MQKEVYTKGADGKHILVEIKESTQVNCLSSVKYSNY